MKTTINLYAPIQAMLKEGGYRVDGDDGILNALKSWQGNPANFVAVEGTAKRSAFKGGHAYKADGTMAIKPLTVKEQTPTEYTYKQDNGSVAPQGELIKFSDAYAAMSKNCGAPSGPLTADVLPSYVRSWLDLKFKGETVKPLATNPALGTLVRETAPKGSKGKSNGTHAVA